MSPSIPKTAFIFAAGLGTRLRPITDTCPKPLVDVAGRPILGHIFDRLAAFGIARVIVNAHHRADQIETFLRTETRFETRYIFEPEILETGGALVNARAIIGHEPFFAINGDAFWEDTPGTNLLRAMASAWNPDRMDILLALYSRARLITPGTGDYRLDAADMPIRTPDKSGDLMFTGIRICHPRVLFPQVAPRFSFLTYMDAAERTGRLAAHVMTGRWYHISTPADLEQIRTACGGARG